jgi:monomeric sarcosine oxidase
MRHSVNLSCFISIDWSDAFSLRNVASRLRYDIIPEIVMTRSFEAAVIGLGAMGSAVALSLARRKASVIGFDRFQPPHSFGSHGGSTRVFRMAYPELPDYVLLAQHAGTFWERLEEETSTRLLTRCGLLTMGAEDSVPIRGIRYCAQHYELPVEHLTAGEIRKRFPAFHPPDDYVGCLETSAGWLDVDTSIEQMHRLARDFGAELMTDSEVTDWQSDGRSAVIRTRTGEYSAPKLIVTGGAWAAKILSDLDLPLKVIRKTFAWFDPLIPNQFAEDAIPIFGFPPKMFYGFPNIGMQGVKVAEHLGGDEVVDPDMVPAAGDREKQPLVETAAKFLPGLAGPPPGDDSRIMRVSNCLYTMTPDENFVLDRHPENGNVFFAAGFSGHGFKFAPLIGEIMADLALAGQTAYPIDFLRLDGRFPTQRYA